MSKQRQSTGLGTFAGVFTPSLLTILGLILFRRMGFVTGGAGLLGLLGILALSHAISILTSSSLSAIATNVRVKGGGDYYLISRSLGVEFGGALGVVLFCAQAVSVAFYCIGLGEAVSPLVTPALQEGGLAALVPFATPSGVAVTAVLFLFLFAWAGADWATKLQYLVMLAMAGALTTFFWGGALAFDGETLLANWQAPPEAPGFWVLFALFFPAVTGFTQGVSMSGDLKDPGRSLPRGTFWAVFVSLGVYAAVAIVLAGSRTSTELLADYEAMNHIATIPALVVAGVVAATLSSALASFMGAPRILQALAGDRIFPLLGVFAKGSGAANNPRAGVLLTLVIALFVCSLGGVDVIAPVVSMFFLISYGLLNWATALEARANSPSFRPRFRWFSARTSLLGAVACLGVMLMINPGASGLALALLFALHQFVQRVAGPDRWADSRRDFHYHAVRKNLLAMSKEPVHPRNWRPHLLVFSDTAGRRRPLVRFASWLDGGAGLTTVVRLVEESGPAALARCRSVSKQLVDEMAEARLEAFPLAVAAPNRELAAQTLVQAYGLGPIKANTILFDWDEQRAAGLIVRDLASAMQLGVNVVAYDATEQDWEVVSRRKPSERRIDVWWSDDRTGRLMLLLAYMMTRSDDWDGAPIRLLAAANKRALASLEEQLRVVLDEARVEATLELVPDLVPDTLVSLSRDAAAVFMPLRMRSGRATDLFGQPVEPLLSALPAVALVSAAEDIALGADPEQGGPARIAALRDEHERLAAELAALDGKLAAARARHDAAHGKARQFLAQLDELRHETRPSDDKRAWLERRSKETMQEAAAAERELRKLEEQADTRRTRARAVQKDLTSLRRENGHARSNGDAGKRAPAG